MKKLFTIVLITVMVIGATVAVADNQAPFSAKVPVSQQGLYRVDPDESSLKLNKWAAEVTQQTNVAKYTNGGRVVGAKSGSDLLVIDQLSTVEVFGFRVLDTKAWPAEAKTLDGQDLVTWLISQVTRLVFTDGQVYTCLNVEPFDEKVHKPQAELQMGSKDSQYWTLYRRPDGIWVLCTTTTKGGNGQGTQPQPTPAVPVDPGRDPEVPHAEPQDEGRDGDDNGDGGDTNPIAATPVDPGREQQVAVEESTSIGYAEVGVGLDDDNGDGGYENPLASQGGNPLATPGDTGRD